MTQPQLESLVASMRTGAVLHSGEDQALPEQLTELAATLPEIFGAVEIGCLERIASKLGAEPGSDMFAEVLLLSESRVHVIHPLSNRADEALLASAPASRSIGLLLSQVHARAAELAEAEE
ncbi:MAG TPA: hypothetical protein VEQ59_07985 [Polyangiaceae bacterium]|nr:hypothetical protein [Polyangiaceae bacterium]